MITYHTVKCDVLYCWPRRYLLFVGVSRASHGCYFWRRMETRVFIRKQYSAAREVKKKQYFLRLTI